MINRVKDLCTLCTTEEVLGADASSVLSVPLR